MKKRLFVLIFFLVALVSSYLSVHQLYELHSLRRSRVISNLIFLPQPALRLITLEFSGVISDYLMLKTLAFHGERLMARQKPTSDEYQQTYHAIQQVTNLDPRFWDPYVLAETTLPWEAGMVRETNELLLKAAKARSEDYRPYFFLWFNHSFFLKRPYYCRWFYGKIS